MTLSERERRILADIETHLNVHDPRFAARMRSRRRSRDHIWLPVALGAWWASTTVVLAARWDALGAITVAAIGVTLAGVTWRLYRR